MRYSSGSQPWHSRPFSIKAKKVQWSVATDGFLLVALRTAGASPGHNVPKDELESMLTATSKSAVEIPVSDLKTWAGEPTAALISAGDVSPEHQGGLLGISIDRRKLSYLLAPVPFLTVSAWLYASDTIGFESEGGTWRAFLAGLSGGIDEEPVFQVQQPKRSTSVFDLAEEVGIE